MPISISNYNGKNSKGKANKKIMPMVMRNCSENLGG